MKYLNIFHFALNQCLVFYYNLDELHDLLLMMGAEFTEDPDVIIIEDDAKNTNLMKCKFDINFYWFGIRKNRIHTCILIVCLKGWNELKCPRWNIFSLFSRSPGPKFHVGLCQHFVFPLPVNIYIWTLFMLPPERRRHIVIDSIQRRPAYRVKVCIWVKFSATDS